mmetsp:Transcript_78656/g.141891  ORF Transcript_78656/g.141891 Transcript_78656/m.141891 type:complete len:217 (-) Transcript_78656:924-1574(-)
MLSPSAPGASLLSLDSTTPFTAASASRSTVPSTGTPATFSFSRTRAVQRCSSASEVRAHCATSATSSPTSSIDSLSLREFTSSTSPSACATAVCLSRAKALTSGSEDPSPQAKAAALSGASQSAASHFLSQNWPQSAPGAASGPTDERSTAIPGAPPLVLAGKRIHWDCKLSPAAGGLLLACSEKVCAPEGSKFFKLPQVARSRRPEAKFVGITRA